MGAFAVWIFLLFLALAAPASAQVYYWENVAGKPGGSGNADGVGGQARFNSPAGVAVDSNGNVYVADYYNRTIRKIAPDGTVGTLAGTPGVSGAADGVGAEAQFLYPNGVAVDADGYVYVTDLNNTIRRVSPDGEVTTLAGSPGLSGRADGTGADARFNNPEGIAVDADKNLYVADRKNSTIRKITAAGVVTTLAGSGSNGYVDGQGTSARFTEPNAVAVDSSGNVYVTDAANNNLRKITAAGSVSTLAGRAQAGGSGSADGTGANARFKAPEGVAVDAAGYLYVADQGNHTIRKVSPLGVVTTLSGSAGQAGMADATGSNARFNSPRGITVSGSTLYVADFNNFSVRKVTAAGVVSTLAGSASYFGSTDATGSNARFNTPWGVAVDGTSGVVYVADSANSTIRKISLDGVVSTLAGSPSSSGTQDGLGASALFLSPEGLALDRSGNLYVADTGNHTIRKITPAGWVSTVAGQPGIAGATDGTGGAALFNQPAEMVLDGTGALYVADAGNNVIRKVSPAGEVTTLAGTAGVSGTDDGSAAAALFKNPSGVALDRLGNLYIADTDNHTIRKLTVDGTVSTFAGLPGTSGTDDGAALDARFNFPTSLDMDSTGNLYVADASNNTIRKITPAGVVSTIGGVPNAVGASDGYAEAARLSGPVGIAVLGAGALYVADASENRIVRGSPKVKPVVVTGAATAVSSTVATMNASVTYPNPGMAWFQWSTSPTLLNSSSTPLAAVPFGTLRPVYGIATGLQPNTKYYYRAFSTGLGLTGSGAIMSFTTGTAALTTPIQNLAASNVSGSSAVVAAAANPKGTPTTVYFQYGLTSDYGMTTPSQPIGASNAVVAVTGSLSGLLGAKEYHYRLVTVSALGTFYGPDQTFATDALSGLIVNVVGLDDADGVPGAVFALSGLGSPVINNLGHYAFSASIQAKPRSGVTVSGLNNAGIWFDPGTGSRLLIARTGSPAPGVNGSLFATLNDPILNNNDLLAFRGTLKIATGDTILGNNIGIWFYNSGTTSLVLRTKMQAPQCPQGAVFSDFTQFVVSDSGRLMVLATLDAGKPGVPGGGGVTTKNNQGIWSIDANRNATLIARTGDVQNVDGMLKTIRSITIFPAQATGAGRSVNAAGNAIFRLTFTDGTQAVETIVFP